MFMVTRVELVLNGYFMVNNFNLGRNPLLVLLGYLELINSLDHGIICLHSGVHVLMGSLMALPRAHVGEGFIAQATLVRFLFSVDPGVCLKVSRL